MSIKDGRSAFSSVAPTCKLRTLNKQAFEGEVCPDGNVQCSLSAACVTMQTAISFKGGIIKYLMRFTRRRSAHGHTGERVSVVQCLLCVNARTRLLLCVCVQTLLHALTKVCFKSARLFETHPVL